MRIATIAASTAGALILAACSAPPENPPADAIQRSQDPSGFQNISVPATQLPSDYLREGQPLDAARLAQVRPGAARQAVSNALGAPVLNSADGRSSEYHVKLPLPPGQGGNHLVCQYLVNFDANGAVASAQWRRPQCAAIANAMRPAPAPVQAQAPRVISVSTDVLFDFGSAQLRLDGQRELDRVATPLRSETVPLDIQILGHSDRIGSEQVNRQLSLERARSVRDYLIGRGIPSSSLSIGGRGSSEPVVQCEGRRVTAELKNCLAPNRRVTLLIRNAQAPGGGTR